MSSIKKENLHDRTIKIKKNARTTLAAPFYPTVQSWTRVSTMFPLLSLYILKPLLRNVSFKYLKKKKITKWRVKILLCNDFPRNYCIPLHPQLSAIGLFRISFDRSGQLDERERKKGKNIPDNCDDNGKNDRWKRDPEVVDVLTPIQTDARWKFSTSFASFDRARIARLFLHRRPTSPPKIAGFLSWTVRQVQVTHFDRDSPRVAFERFRKITEKEFDRCPSIVLQTNFKFSARKSSLIRFRRIWKNWKSFHKKKKRKSRRRAKKNKKKEPLKG